MNWRTKGLIQKILSLLPGGNSIHFWMQKRFGGLHVFDKECLGKINDWKIMLGHVSNAEIDLPNATLYEIGTGWYPTLPLCSYLAGVQKSITVDINKHLSEELTVKCAQLIATQFENIIPFSKYTQEEISAKHQLLITALKQKKNLQDASDGKIHYMAPCDATNSGLDNGCIDLVYSNSVLEHIPQKIITAMFKESHRILRSGGLMFHSVNCGDHYSYFDKSIHQLNYLKYDEMQWRFWNNSFLYQNRLRAIEFIKMATAENFEIVLDTSQATEKRLTQLKQISIAKCFQDYAPEELCKTTIDFIAKKR